MVMLFILGALLGSSTCMLLDTLAQNKILKEQLEDSKKGIYTSE